MSVDETSAGMDDDLKLRFRSVLSVGCDRQTACRLLGISAQQLTRELHRDADFNKAVQNAEASPEYNHMKNVYQAGQDEKNWRASVWWLERSAPERFARRPAAALTAKQVQQVINELVDVIVAEICDATVQQKLLSRLTQYAQQVRDAHCYSPPDLGDELP